MHATLTPTNITSLRHLSKHLSDFLCCIPPVANEQRHKLIHEPTRHHERRVPCKDAGRRGQIQARRDAIVGTLADDRRAPGPEWRHRMRWEALGGACFSTSAPPLTVGCHPASCRPPMLDGLQTEATRGGGDRRPDASTASGHRCPLRDPNAKPRAKCRDVDADEEALRLLEHLSLSQWC